MPHALRSLASAALVVALLAGCGAATVSGDTVAEQAEAEFSRQFPVDSVECPDDLPAEVGASITCVLVSEGTSFEMTATATDVEGDQVDFDLELTDEL